MNRSEASKSFWSRMTAAQRAAFIARREAAKKASPYRESDRGLVKMEQRK